MARRGDYRSDSVDEYGSDEGEYPMDAGTVGANIIPDWKSYRQPTEEVRMKKRLTSTKLHATTDPPARYPHSTQQGKEPLRTVRDNHKGKNRRERKAEVEADEFYDRICEGGDDTHTRKGKLRADKTRLGASGGRVRIPDDPRESAGAGVQHLSDWFYISPTDCSPGGEIYMTDGCLSQLRSAVSSLVDEDPPCYADVPGELIGLCSPPSINVDRKGLEKRFYTRRADNVVILVHVVTEQRFHNHLELFKARNGRYPDDLPMEREKPRKEVMRSRTLKAPSSVGSLLDIDDQLFQEIPEDNQTSTRRLGRSDRCVNAQGRREDLRSERMSPMEATAVRLLKAQELIAAKQLAAQQEQSHRSMESQERLARAQIAIMREMWLSPVPFQQPEGESLGWRPGSLAKLPIDKFSGNDYVHNRLVLYQDWARELVIKAEAVGVTGDLLAEKMVLLLKTPALDAYMGLPESTRKSWDLLHKAMKETFDPDDTYAAEKNFRELMMEETESAEDYFTRVQRGSRRAYPEMQDDWMKGIWKKSFINGLPYRMQQVMIQMGSAKMTVEECVDAVESCNNSHRQMRVNMPEAATVPLIWQTGDDDHQRMDHVWVSEPPVEREGSADYYGYAAVTDDRGAPEYDYMPVGYEERKAIEYDDGWCPSENCEGDMRNNSVLGADRMADHLRSDESPVFVGGCVGGVNCRVMVDSGSAISLMDAEFFRRYFPPSILIAAGSRAKVYGFCGDRCDLMGTATIRVTVAQHQRDVLFQVISGGKFDALLGRNWFNRIGAITMNTWTGFIQLNRAAPIPILPAPYRNVVSESRPSQTVKKRRRRKRRRRKRSEAEETKGQADERQSQAEEKGTGRVDLKPNLHRNDGRFSPIDLHVRSDLGGYRLNNLGCAVKAGRDYTGDSAVQRKVVVRTTGQRRTVAAEAQEFRAFPIVNVQRRRWSWPNSKAEEVDGKSSGPEAYGNGRLARAESRM